MKKFKINRIEIKDFKAQNRTVVLSDKTRITGRNASGKTTVMSAFNWLLTGVSDANTNKNADLFDNRFELNENTPKASVKAWIEIDGVETCIERTAKAKFTKERGSNEYKKANSDDYGFIIDEIEVPAKRFDEWIETNIAPVSALRFCMSGEFFVNLALDDWQKARVILLQIVGEINNNDFKGDYSLIENMLRNFSIDEIKERSKKRISEYDKSIENANTQLAANQDKIAEYKAIDYESLDKQIKEHEEEIKQIDELMLQKSNSIEPFVKARNEAIGKKQQFQQKLSEIREAYNRDEIEKENEVKAQINSVDKENDAIKKRNDEKKRQYNDAAKRKESLEAKKLSIEKENTQLREQLHEVKSRIFNEDKCAYCGQTLPEDMLEKNRAMFNEKKEKERSTIVERGKANNALIEQINNEIAEIEKTLSIDINSTLEQFKSKAELEDRLNQLRLSFVPFEKTETYSLKKAEIDAIEIPEIPTIDNEENNSRKRFLIGEIKQLSARLGFRDEITRLEKKNEELNENIRQFGIESVKEKQIIDKCKERQQEIADITSERVNGRMKSTVIAMQRKQKDGQEVPTCEITQVDGTRYTTSNGAARILMKIDLQVMFCEHYGIAMPIFVDECSIIDEFNTPSFDGFQMIYLYNTNDSFKVEEM